MIQCKTKSENLAHILGYQIWAVTGRPLQSRAHCLAWLRAARDGGRHSCRQPLEHPAPVQVLPLIVLDEQLFASNFCAKGELHAINLHEENFGLPDRKSVV